MPEHNEEYGTLMGAARGLDVSSWGYSQKYTSIHAIDFFE